MRAVTLLLATAIIICPGGGYHHLAVIYGAPVAQWLNSIGVTYVLHHRR